MGAVVSQQKIGESTLTEGTFNEQFFNSGPPIPFLPSTKEERKKGGYKTYGILKSQGDCVSFVAAQGKNEPGKNQPNKK